MRLDEPSVSAQETAAVRSRARSSRAVSARVTGILEQNGTLVLAVTAFAVVMLLASRGGLVVDGWMALASGREIAQHGLPTHDALTVWAHGERWIDQQWLAQLAFYGLAQLGGLKLALFAHLLLCTGAVTGAAILAVRIGGSARSATWVCLPVFIAYYPEAGVLRPQSFGYPLFVAVLWLLLADGRRRSNRVFLVLPLIALWANLHGSVLLGAGLVSLAGLVGVGEALLARPRRLDRRSLLLLLGPWPCLLVSPYAVHLPTYYEKILIGGNFSHFVTEWAPTTLTPTTAPVYLLILGGMWLLGRAGGALSLFEKLAFLATSVLAFEAVRNTAWIALTALVVLPRLIDAVRRPAVEPAQLNRIISKVMIGAVAVTTIGVAAKPTSWFTGGFPSAAVTATADGAGTDGKVFAMSPYADWLLWRRPELRGRLAFDARFELFRSADVKRLARIQARSGDWMRGIDGYRVFVLDPRHDGALRDALTSRRIARVAYADSDVVVLWRIA